MKAGIYVRLSQDREGEGIGVAGQQQDCRALAERLGWDVTKVYSDNDVSAGGRKRNRPAWRQLLLDLEAGQVGAVLAYSSSRMYRHVRDLLDFIDVVERHGVPIATVVSGNIDLTTADGRMMAGILAQVDQREWEATSERWKAQKRRAIAEARYTGGESEPYGYRRVDGALQVDPEEAATIHDAVSRIAGGVSLSRITVDLNDAGRTTAKGARWRPVSMRRLLVSDHLTGERGYPRILSDEEAAVVRARFAAEERKAGRPAGRRHPLGGLLRCAECGSTITGSGPWYRCTTAAGGCGHIGIKAFPLERYVLLESLRHWYETRSGDERAQEGRPPEPDPAALAELRQIEEDLEATRALVGSGAMRPADAAPILKALAARQAAASERVARTLQTAPEPPVRRLTQVFTRDELHAAGIDRPAGGASAEEFHMRWEAREPEAVAVVRDLVTSQVEHVTVSRRAVRGRGFDPTRVTVRWRR